MLNNKPMVDLEKVQLDLIKLVDGERLLRLTDPRSGLSLEKNKVNTRDCYRITNPDIRERVSARFDNKRGLGAVYGVPALAGRVLPFKADQNTWRSMAKPRLTG
jgi:hypothetical protein